MTYLDSARREVPPSVWKMMFAGKGKIDALIGVLGFYLPLTNITKQLKQISVTLCKHEL